METMTFEERERKRADLAAVVDANRFKVKLFDVTMKDGTVLQKRLFTACGCGGGRIIAEFNKGSRKFGNELPLDGVVSIAPHVARHRMDEADKFDRNCDRVIAILEMSGLWDNVLSDVRYLKEIGYDAAKRYENDYWAFDSADGDEREMRRKSVPGAFNASTAGMMLNFKMVTMRMADADWYNADILNRMRRAMNEGRKFSERHECRSYDRTFEYDPEQKKAWYSLEYRNCGNGHYYLALNAEKALFCEDD